MTNYLIYVLVGLILLFIIYIAFKALIRGFKAKDHINFINEKVKRKPIKIKK